MAAAAAESLLEVDSTPLLPRKLRSPTDDDASDDGAGEDTIGVGAGAGAGVAV